MSTSSGRWVFEPLRLRLLPNGSDRSGSQDVRRGPRQFSESQDQEQFRGA